MARIIKFEGREISVPDDATDDEVSSIIGGQQSADSFQNIYASVPYRLAKSMKDPVDALAQLTPYALSKVTSVGGLYPNKVSNWLQSESERVSQGLKEEESQYQAARQAVAQGDPGFDWTRLAGNVANPISYVGATKAAKLMPAVTSPVGSKVAQGMLGGATYGALQPVYDDNIGKQKAEQIGFGAVLGGAIPLGAEGLKKVSGTVGDVLKVFTPNGYKSLSIDALRKKVGDENIPAVVEALNRSEQLVKGSIPTAGESIAGLPAGSPLAAYQKVAAEQAGGSSAKFGERWLDQKLARAKALSFAGTDEDLARAVQARTEATQPLYSAVEQSKNSVKVSPVMSYLNSTIDKNANRDAISNPLKKIRDGLIVATETGSKLENRPQRVKSLIDQVKDMMASRTPDGQPQYDVKVLAEAKALLEKQLSSSVPEYAKAQKVFADMSVPVNQMQVGRFLQDKLINPTGTETPRAFINTLDDAAKLIKKSTGMSRYNKIDDVLTPENAAAAKSVALDLERSLSAKSPIQRTNIGAGNVSGDVAQFPQLLSRAVTIMNAAIRMGKGDIEEKSHAYLANLYLNPKELGALLAKTPAKDRSTLVKAVNSYGKQIATVTPSIVMAKEIGQNK